MSETITIDDGEAVVRRPPRRREREIEVEKDDGITFDGGGSDSASPEDVLADSQRQLREKDEELAHARRAQQESEARRVQAEQHVAQSNVARVSDRHAAVAGALEAANSEKAAARIALRMAHESGDIDAMADAQEAISTATFRASQAASEIEWIKANPPQRQQQAAEPEISNEAKKWLDSHPMFYSDDAYRATAEGAHSSALRAGHADGSRRYIDHIEGIMTKVYGSGHGREGAQPRQQEGSRNMREDDGGRGSGAPPSRQNGGGTGGYKEHVIGNLGTLLVQKRADGTMGVRFKDQASKENFIEGAETCRMDLKKYLADFIENGTDDLITGEGRFYQ